MPGWQNSIVDRTDTEVNRGTWELRKKTWKEIDNLVTTNRETGKIRHKSKNLSNYRKLSRIYNIFVGNAPGVIERCSIVI